MAFEACTAKLLASLELGNKDWSLGDSSSSTACLDCKLDTRLESCSLVEEGTSEEETLASLAQQGQSSLVSSSFTTLSRI